MSSEVLKNLWFGLLLLVSMALPGHLASLQKADILFPPARPSLRNVPALCAYIDSRPWYPPNSFPFDYLNRYAETINRVESWYGICCQSNETLEQNLTLCCAQQAWEQALSQFCEEEFGLKISHYHCCMRRGQAQWSCFKNDAPNASYIPARLDVANMSSPPEPGFTWDRSMCQSSKEVAHAELEDVPRIKFPPGRPTSENVQAICRLRNLRPLYPPVCEPRKGYSWLVRQAKAINKLEKEINRCCEKKVDVLPCLDGKWRDVMDQFCQDEQSVRAQQFPCCEFKEQAERYACFSSQAPDKHYLHETLQSPAIVPAIITKVCDTHSLLVKVFAVQVPLEDIVTQCCHLPLLQTHDCVETKLNNALKDMCSGKKMLPKDISPDCCTKPVHGRNCLSRLLLPNIRRALDTKYFQKMLCRHF